MKGISRGKAKGKAFAGWHFVCSTCGSIWETEKGDSISVEWVRPATPQLHEGDYLTITVACPSDGTTMRSLPEIFSWEELKEIIIRE